MYKLSKFQKVCHSSCLACLNLYVISKVCWIKFCKAFNFSFPHLCMSVPPKHCSFLIRGGVCMCVRGGWVGLSHIKFGKVIGKACYGSYLPSDKSRCCCNKTPSTTERNLDFFTRTPLGKSAKMFTRKLFHAICPRNLMQSCAISMCLL